MEGGADRGSGGGAEVGREGGAEDGMGGVGLSEGDDDEEGKSP